MCGIAGAIGCGAGFDGGRGLVEAMLDDLGHRGPDGAGMFVDGEVALGHRRLAILDLSEGGRQPMTSRDGRWTIVLNGEIFNYLELREELGRDFRGSSSPGSFSGSYCRTSTDTEVLLEACAVWGVEKALERSNGMFAFALWDARERELTLARDRVGEKPLVYSTAGPALVFASELKALRRWSGGRMDAAAVDAYLALGYVPAPLSIFRDCKKLPAGHLLRVRNGRVSVGRWWFPENAPRAASRGDPADRAAQLRERMGEAVRLRLRSDVPVALLLSGGVDSSVIAAECAKLGARPRAFTVAFDGGDGDAQYAGTVARRFGLEHEIVQVSAKSITDDIEELLRPYDEPFADSSALPSLALARALGGRYKVALTGDGGDEAFGGYRHYQAIEWKQAAKAVAAVAGLVDGRGAGATARYIESKALFRSTERARLLHGHTGGDALGNGHTGVNALGNGHTGVNALGNGNTGVNALGNGNTGVNALGNGNAGVSAPGKGNTGGDAPGAGANVSLRALIGRDEFLAQCASAAGALKRALWSDRHLYLANDLTYKMDIALGAHGMEGRGPFLDRGVLEWAQGLEARDLVRGGRKKILLRAAYRGIVPDEILDRAKLGFGAPVGRWIEGPLAEFARDLEPCPLLEHLAGKRLSGERRWALAVFSNWARAWKATW